MREAWPSETIDSLIKSGAIIGHQDGNHGSLYPRVSEFGTEGVPFLTAKLIQNGRVDLNTAPRLAHERARELRIGFAKPGDVLLSHNATIGRVAIVPEYLGTILIGTSLTYFRLDSRKLSARYLAAYLSGPDFQRQLEAVMSHTTRDQVPITAQRKLRVVVPPLRAQEGIANAVGSLDDKIELNRRVNETLEAMARALFKSWFVSFDPVRAKAEGRAPVGMDGATAALFPDGFEETEIGEVPRGWTAGPLSNYVERHVDRVKSSDEWAAARLIDLSRIPQHSLSAVDWGLGEELTTSVTRFAAKDTLFGAIRPYFHKVLLAPFDGVTNISVFCVRSSEDRTLWPWVSVLLSEDSVVAHATSVSQGTKMPVVTWEGLTQLVLPVAPIAIRLAFAKQVEPLLELALSNVMESAALAQVRGLLLPRLLTGELSVRDADRIVERPV